LGPSNAIGSLTVNSGEGAPAPVEEVGGPWPEEVGPWPEEVGRFRPPVVLAPVVDGGGRRAARRLSME
jgi:hypothetical protein